MFIDAETYYVRDRTATNYEDFCKHAAMYAKKLRITDENAIEQAVTSAYYMSDEPSMVEYYLDLCNNNKYVNSQPSKLLNRLLRGI